MSPQTIPAEMQALKRWVCYRLEADAKNPSKKAAKVPYQLNGAHASSTNPDTWVTFDQAQAAVQSKKFDGISYALAAEDGLVCVDLDHARNPETGEPEEWAAPIIYSLASYTEVSPSGTGYHIFIRGSIPKASHKQGSKVELYAGSKIMATTGELGFQGYETIESRPAELAEVFKRAEAGEFAPDKPRNEPTPAPTNGCDESVEDWKLIAELCRNLKSRNPDEIEATLKQKYPERYEARNRAKGSRNGKSYFWYTIANYLRKEAATVQPKPSDWRDVFRDPNSLAEGDVRILIEKILPEGVIMLGSNSGVGKTWCAISMLKALITGKPFLGVFPVKERRKVLYLIPEVGDRSLRRRLTKMRVPLDGECFRVRTLADGIMNLSDPLLLAAVKEWQPVIFLDTAVRFSKVKDENSAAENATLADAIFALIKAGAVAVVGLHHSLKSTAKASAEELTLENVLRGTGDLGAMCDTVWGIQHDKGTNGGSEEYVEESRNLTRLFLKNVKPRDFDPAEPFRIQGRPYIDERGDFVVLTGDVPDGDKNSFLARKLAELVFKNPKQSKKALAKIVRCDRSRVEELLGSVGWRWNNTSKTTGEWVYQPLLASSDSNNDDADAGFGNIESEDAF